MGIGKSVLTRKFSAVNAYIKKKKFQINKQDFEELKKKAKLKRSKRKEIKIRAKINQK